MGSKETNNMPEDSLTKKHSVGLESKTEDGGLTPPPRIQSNSAHKPDAKFILDATAGFRMMWYDKQHPNAVYIDQRPECEPDFVMDWSKKLDFQDKSFKLVVFDPPHIVQGNTANSNQIIQEYGALKPETWRADLKTAFNELWRVLDEGGILLFKWATPHVSSNEVLALIPQKPLFYQIVQKTSLSKKARNNKVRTLWFCFMKKPEVSL